MNVLRERLIRSRVHMRGGASRGGNVKLHTLSKDRGESSVQFIETAKELMEHTWRYLHKLPKSTRFTIQQKINDAVIRVYTDVSSANAIFARKDSVEDKEEKRKYIVDALCVLNTVEGLLSSVQNIYKQEISDYGWQNWGKLITEEKKLLTGLLKKI